MQVNFTMQEILGHMLKCMMQLQRVAPNPPLPTSRLLLRHALESLIFVPNMVLILVTR